ncbi:DUF6941 family protein [Aquipseudomonas alcaligenes]|uniref:DUF6941 family protein n=1 Tax=Aquipseudomonas alcaligenes TaxID=43263 RepID=UPI0036667B7B
MSALNRHASVIYCDDIRYEIGGKVTYVGTYGDAMFLKEFPATIPKLWISIRVVTPSQEPFKEIRVAVFQDDCLIAETTASPDPTQPLPTPTSEEVIHAQTGTFVYCISPLVLEHECIIRVRVFEDDTEVIRGNALHIKQATPETVFPPS